MDFAEIWEIRFIASCMMCGYICDEVNQFDESILVEHLQFADVMRRVGVDFQSRPATVTQERFEEIRTLLKEILAQRHPQDPREFAAEVMPQGGPVSARTVLNEFLIRLGDPYLGILWDYYGPKASETWIYS